MPENGQFLDFEQPVIELEQQLVLLRAAVEGGDLSQAGEVEKLQKKLERLRDEVFGNLTPYQRVRLSRHFGRPFTMDYVERLLTNPVELHGDRHFRDDPAMVGFIGMFERKPVMVVGHQRGKSTQERIRRNFGMPQPEGNRKAQRLFLLAEKFKLPLLLFIDTQGAYPGLEAEARGQAESIAKSLQILAGLKTPIISTVIGEGGSGGALALGVSDRLLMLENSTFSVITPEGCASILWGKTNADNVAAYAKVAAESLRLTANALHEAGIVDEVIKEPVGGAHRSHSHAAELLKHSISQHLFELVSMPTEELLEKRFEKLRQNELNQEKELIKT